MGDEKAKANPDVTVTTPWRSVSRPDWRVPAPSLEPVTPSRAAVPPLPPRDAASTGVRPVSNSSYSVVPTSQETILPLSHRPISAPGIGVPLSQPAYVAPRVAPVQPGIQSASAAAPRRTFRPASDGFQHPASNARSLQSLALDTLSDGRPSAVSLSRRAGDPTRLLPWLRDKNKRLGQLSDADCDAVFRFASLHRVEAGTILQAVDGAPTACFAITSGAIAVRVRRSNGAMRELDRYGPGDLVGLLSLIDSRPSPYEILAASAVELIAFEADQLAQYAAALHPDALAAIHAWTPLLIEHLRSIQTRVARLAGVRTARLQSNEDDAWRGIK